MSQSETNVMFLQLVMSLEAAAMQQLGKIQNSFTGKIERNLELAKSTIDMLEMFEKKTAGNLSHEEEAILKRVLFQLRMNYVDELKADRKEPEDRNERSAEGNSPPGSEQPEESSEP